MTVPDEPSFIADTGLPGVGKTTVARAVSERVGGVHLRLDTIECALVRSGWAGALRRSKAPDRPGSTPHCVQVSDLDGLVVPTWEQVQAREYEPWDGSVLRVDTAAVTEVAVDEIVAAICAWPAQGLPER